LVKTLDGVPLDRKIHAVGWNFFFVAAKVKVMFFSVLGGTKIQNALRRMLQKVREQHFNGLEVTGIASSHFLGGPYVTVSAHSRHMQRGCYLDSSEARQASIAVRNWPRAEPVSQAEGDLNSYRLGSIFAEPS
jgi:hypothetical protein